MPAGPSMSSVQGLYSTCTAAMGCTACPRRRVADEHSEKPMCLILPSLLREGAGGRRESSCQREGRAIYSSCSVGWGGGDEEDGDEDEEEEEGGGEG